METSFEVNDSTEIQDLTSVPDTDESLFPVMSRVKLNIKKAGVNNNKDNNLKALSLGLQCLEGIQVTNAETGEEEVKYKNVYVNHGWMDFCFYASPDRPDLKGWFKAGKHLIGFKQLMKALDYPMTGLVVNDEFLQGLIGKDIVVDVRHEKDKNTGQISLKVKNIKKAE